MHRLFAKIFLWFWLTALGTFAVIAGSRMLGLRSIRQTELIAVFAPKLAAEAARAYESGGAPGFVQFSRSLVENQDRQLYLIDGFGNDVLSRAISQEGRTVAQAARMNGSIILGSGLRRRIAGYKFVSASGRPYVVLLSMQSISNNPWEILVGDNLLLSGGVVLMVTLLCLWLAYHIASPIHSIQSAARRVAQGDLNAKVPLSISKRHDELASLAVDFNSMVEHLGVLIHTQRDLFNSISHEVRSPLARLTVSLALIREHLTPTSEGLLDQMERDMAKVDTLMTQILILARLGSGLSSGSRESVDFSQLVLEVAADGDFEAQGYGKSVSVKVAESIVLKNGDSHALRSACENIVRNAIRFSPPGGKVEVTLAIRTDGEPRILLSIRDHGPGVAEEHLKNIFQPFFRLAQIEKGHDGNGLGLAIAYEAIRFNGGDVTACNISPSGLNVEVNLPLGAVRIQRA